MPVRQMAVIKLTPYVIDSDHAGNVVRMKIHDIGFPSVLQIIAGIAADPHIDNPHPEIGTAGCQQSIHQRGISFAQILLAVFGDRTGTSHIRDRIADHHQRGIIFKQAHIT